jgi:hypothetical protein
MAVAELLFNNVLGSYIGGIRTQVYHITYNMSCRYVLGSHLNPCPF